MTAFWGMTTHFWSIMKYSSRRIIAKHGAIIYCRRECKVRVTVQFYPDRFPTIALPSPYRGCLWIAPASDFVYPFPNWQTRPRFAQISILQFANYRLFRELGSGKRYLNILLLSIPIVEAARSIFDPQIACHYLKTICIIYVIPNWYFLRNTESILAPLSLGTGEGTSLFLAILLFPVEE